jgi:hypothetical protein
MRTKEANVLAQTWGHFATSPTVTVVCITWEFSHLQGNVRDETNKSLLTDK